jgi:glucose-6-phosphate isomerase
MTTVAIDGLFAPALEGGIARERLDELADEARNAHRELMSRRGKDVGFYDVPSEREAVVKAITTEVTRLRSLADDLLVLGTGGSSLGGQAICAALDAARDPSFRVHFLDNVDPDTLATTLDRLDPARSCVLAVSKSGRTLETLAELLILRRWLRVSLGQGETRSRTTFVTNPDDGSLRDLAQTEGIRAFDIPANVGGPYSALTPAGLLPAAFAGIDIAAILDGAAAMAEAVTADEVLQNPACMLAAGAVLASSDLECSSLVFMPYADALRATSHWFVQLWAGSLGRRFNRLGEEVRSGPTPIPALGVNDQHSLLRLIVDGPVDKAVLLVKLDKPRCALPIPDELADREEAASLHGRDLGEVLEASFRATRAALLEAGVPVIQVTLPTLDPHTVGGLFMLLEAACACTGIMIGVNPFEHPGVVASQRMALGLLGRPGYEGEAERVVAREALGKKGSEE